MKRLLSVILAVTMLTAVTFSHVTAYGEEEIPDKAHFNDFKLQFFTVPDGVKVIGESAFENCLSLQKVDLPEGLEEIKANAFAQCETIHAFKLPSTLKALGKEAFSGCISLVNIEIPASVTEIPDLLFLSCTHVRKIILPDTLTSIGTKAFYDCHDAEIYFRGSEEQWNAITDGVMISNENIPVHYNYTDPVGAPIDENTIRVLLNGEYLVTDTNPVIVNDRVLVPVRAIMEKTSRVVEWDENTRTVSVGSVMESRPRYTITIGEYAIYMYGSTKYEIDVPAQIINNRTMIPIRAFAEVMNGKVTWDSEARTVIIETGFHGEGGIYEEIDKNSQNT